MDLRTIRKAYLADQLTADETSGKLIRLWPEGLPSWVLIEAWDLIKDLQAELKAAQRQNRTPRLAFGTVADLIDHAFLTGHIDKDHAIDALVAEGMMEGVAATHVAAIKAIRDKDAERAAYLADPDYAPRYCTRCGKETPADDLSNRALCGHCRDAAVYQAYENLRNKHGPVYRKWREKMLQSMYHLETELLQENNEREPSTLGDMIDHDKAPPCQGDCYDCPEEDCKSRVEPCLYDSPYDDHDGWYCPECSHLNRNDRVACGNCRFRSGADIAPPPGYDQTGDDAEVAGRWDFTQPCHDCGKPVSCQANYQGDVWCLQCYNAQLGGEEPF